MAEHAWLRERPIAHRGLHDLAAGRPENSLAAFMQACELDYPAELDVRLASDGEVMVIHDASLRRLTGVDRLVRDTPAHEIARLSLLGTGERIPRLSEVLDAVAGRVPLLLDFKPSTLGTALEDAVVRAVAGYEGPVAMEAFSPLSLLKLKALGVPSPRGQVSGCLSSAPPIVRSIGRRMAMNAVVAPDFIAYELAALPSAAASFWRRRGLPIIAWTVQSPEDAERAGSLADNYLFSGFTPAVATSAGGRRV